MNKNPDRSPLIIAFLLGVCVALALTLVFKSDTLPRAHAQTGGQAGQFFGVTGTGTQGQSKDILFLVDTGQQRLAVYEYQQGRLELGAIRNIEYELRFETWNKTGRNQKPSVKDMKKMSEKSDKKK